MTGLVKWTPPSPRRDLVETDPMNSSFLKTELAKMGQMRPPPPPPPTGTPALPTSAALITLPFCCSQNGQPFYVTLGKDRSNEPYHIKSLEPTYTKLLTASGYGLSAAVRQSIGNDQCDWTGFQCFHCGAGRCVGNSHDWVYCTLHQFAFCGNRVEAIHGGGFKCRCPSCARWSMIAAAPMRTLNGIGYVASRGNASPPSRGAWG
jgi:hypothetical protein